MRRESAEGKPDDDGWGPSLAVGWFWPEYAAHGRVWFQQHVYEFTTGMSAVNASFWVLSEIVAGWLAVAIPAVPAVLCGVWLARSSARPA